MLLYIYWAWILAPDIGQCLAKNRVMSDKNCFKTDTNVGCIVKKIFTSWFFHKHGPFLLWFFFSQNVHEILIDNLLMKFFFIFKTVTSVWVWEKRFYTNTLLLFGQLLLWKHFICYYIALNLPWLGKWKNRQPSALHH